MVDVNLKVPAIEKLLDYAASGIGAVAGPMLATWRARQEAKAKLIGVQVEADSLRLIADAQADARRSLVEPDQTGSGMLEIGADGIAQRIEFQEKKRQANIVSVVQDAAAELGGKEVPDREPDPDWTARFFDGVKDVSSEDMRKIWTRILAGEVESPGRTALRTLDVLRNMTREEAEIFKSACEFIIDDFIFYPRKDRTTHPVLQQVDVMRLQDADLLHTSTSLAKILNFFEGKCHIPHRGFCLRIISNENRESISIPAIPLTRSGRDLSQVLERDLCIKNLRLFSKFLRDNNCGLHYAQIIEEYSDGVIRHTDFVPIEPEPERVGGATP